MKFLKMSLRFFIGTMSVFVLAACGGGSGGPGGPGGLGGSSASSPPVLGAPLPNLGNIAGVTLTGDGGLILTAEALNTLGLQAAALTPQELARLNVTLPNAGVGARVLTSQGQIVAITGPGGRTFGVPGGPSTLPGTGVRLPVLPRLLNR